MKGRTFTLVDSNRPEVAIEVTEATGWLRRMKGLLGRSGIPPGEGLLLKGKQVHTIGMRFAIDVIHLAKEGRVIFVQTLPPNRVGTLAPSAEWVLEMAAGEVERLGIEAGSRLVERK